MRALDVVAYFHEMAIGLAAGLATWLASYPASSSMKQMSRLAGGREPVGFRLDTGDGSAHAKKLWGTEVFMADNCSREQ